MKAPSSDFSNTSLAFVQEVYCNDAGFVILWIADGCTATGTCSEKCQLNLDMGIIEVSPHDRPW